MAFELLFFKHKENKTNLKDIIDYFYNTNNFIVKPLDTNLYFFIYQNLDTKVTFNISYNEEDELITNKSFSEEYEYCYLSFTMNYLRPSFFALEAMPIITDFCNKFNLFIYDTQNKSDNIDLKQYNTEELITLYNSNNELACIEFNKQTPLNYVSQAKTNYYFNYSLNKNKLIDEENINIPDINFIKNLKTNEIFTFFIWEGNETAFPKCDYIYITKKIKGFLGFKKQVSSLLKYQDVIKLFSQYLIKLDNEILELFILQEINDKITDLFQNLPIESFDDFTLIDIDELVDIKFN